MRDFGYGKDTMENTIEEEIDNLFQHIDSHWLDTPLDVSRFFNISALASLWRIISGEQLQLEDPKLIKLLTYNQQMISDFADPLTTISLTSIPIYKFVESLGLLSVVENISNIFKYCDEFIEIEKEKATDGDNPLTFIEAFLHKIKSTDESSHPLYGDRGILNLQNTLLDMFVAGSDTSSTTLNWGMLYMILNPEVQQKVRDELKDNIGSRKPKMTDRNLTPYTEAVIHEIQRKSSIAAIGVFHSTTTPMKIGNFDVPSNTMIIPMLADIMHNPEYFPDPDKFDPERYLTKSEGGSMKFTPDPKVIPFGTGKRRCMGETLARMSLYKFFASLIQKYEISSGQDDLLQDKHSGGFVLSPNPYKMKFTKVKY